MVVLDDSVSDADVDAEGAFRLEAEACPGEFRCDVESDVAEPSDSCVEDAFESGGAAEATPCPVATAVPIPKATASMPTRPMCTAEFMWVLFRVGATYSYRYCP